MLGDVVVVALGAYAGCTVLRFLAERMNLVVSSFAKLLLAAICATAGAAALANDPVDAAVVAVAGLGGATVVHRLHRLLGAAGDRFRMDFIQGNARRY